MNVLVIGGGGREHALVWKLRRSSRVGKIFSAPGNPGIGSLAELVPVAADNVEALVEFARAQDIGLTVVGPEQPLAAGIVDAFEASGLLAFGPTRRAAELEWSKAFAKEFMRAHGIPTADFRSFDAQNIRGALSYAENAPHPIVIKADGLAAGKGVIIAASPDESKKALREIIEQRAFGAAGNRVVIEEFMTGQEASVFAVTDGHDYVLLSPAQDHKRSLDGDMGKNTGGMGAYAPAPCVTPELMARVEREIIVPTLAGMASDGRPYRGCLYVGLMLTPGGPKVVEYNCRFGDPETQVILPLYDGDLALLLRAAAAGEIAELRASGETTTSSGNAVSVVLASGGYPDAYETGKEIRGLENAATLEDAIVFHAGTIKNGEVIVTAGGRVLAVTAFTREGTIREAIGRAYEASNLIAFDGMRFRRDIGKRALDLPR